MQSCEVFEIQVIKICNWNTLYVICILYFAHIEMNFVFCITNTFFTVICIWNTIWTRQFLTQTIFAFRHLLPNLWPTLGLKMVTQTMFTFVICCPIFSPFWGFRVVFGVVCPVSGMQHGHFWKPSPGASRSTLALIPHGVDSPYNSPVVYRQLVNMSDGSHLWFDHRVKCGMMADEHLGHFPSLGTHKLISIENLSQHHFANEGTDQL